jgi:hypothetical protein
MSAVCPTSRDKRTLSWRLAPYQSSASALSPLVGDALLTSDCEIPNCRAIAEGLTPALKAARTAFSLPVVSAPAPPSAGAALRGPDLASAFGLPVGEVGVGRPRRLASAVTAASRESTSAPRAAPAPRPSP